MKILIGAFFIGTFALFALDSKDLSQDLISLIEQVPHHRNLDQVNTVIVEFNEVLKIHLSNLKEPANLKFLNTLAYLQGGSTSILLNNQSQVIAGCSWAAKIFGLKLLDESFRKQLIDVILKLNIQDVSMSETIINTSLGNNYLATTIEIHKILESFNIGILCGMYLVPVSCSEKTFAGLTSQGMVVWVLDDFKQDLAAAWQHSIAQRSFGIYESKFDPSEWDNLERALESCGGIELLGKPTTWNLIKRTINYLGQNKIELKNESSIDQ
jgi:hypothetical protein